jgi:NitT/TauT family transport system permease protein
MPRAEATRAERVRKGAMSRARFVVPVIATLVIVVSVWAFVTAAFNIPQYMLPAPASLFDELVGNPGLYWRHGLVTLTEAVIGFFLGTFIGFTLAVILDTSSILERSLIPYLIMFTNIPIVAFAPIVVIYFGFGPESKIVTAAFLTFFPVVIYTLKGLKSADLVHRDLFHVLAAPKRVEFYKLRLPSALPFLFSALKIAATASVLAAVVAEFIQALEGLGWLILQSSYTLDMARLWSTVIVSSAIAVAFYSVVVLVERKVTPWHSSMVARQ